MTETTERNQDDVERLQKILSQAGIASRRASEQLMLDGRVTVNGETIRELGTKADLSTDDIRVDGRRIKVSERHRYVLLNKPKGYVTTRSDPERRATVMDLLKGVREYIYPVGRLDYDTEGLLLLTNDGELKRRLELPSTGWLRKYRVRVKGNPTDPDLDPLRKGVTIEGERFQPMDVKLDRHQGANAWLTVGIREGKNREIRRAMAHVGLTVNRLIRTSYGPFRLNEMKPGEVEEVKPRILRDQLGLTEEGEPRPKRSAPKADPKPAPKAGRSTDDPAKPARKTLKPGEGLKTLSETWKKATRPPARSGDDRPPADRGKPARGTGPRPGPRPKGPRQG